MRATCGSGVGGGLWALTLALIAFIVAATCTTWVLHGAPLALDSVIAATVPRITTGARLLWCFMGLVTAYKLAAHRDA